jgi:hypothetical protein
MRTEHVAPLVQHLLCRIVAEKPPGKLKYSTMYSNKKKRISNIYCVALLLKNPGQIEFKKKNKIPV